MAAPCGLGWMAAIPLVIICVTGTVLVFEKQLLQSEQSTGAPMESSQWLSPPEVFRLLLNSGVRVNHFGIPADPGKPFFAFATRTVGEDKGKNIKLLVDPYSGVITRVDNRMSLSKIVIDLHRELALGAAGKQVVAGSSVVLALTSLVGLILWWPMRRGTMMRARKRRGVLDWHNVVGLAALLPLLIMAVTGVSFTWGKTIFPQLEKIQGSPIREVVPVVVVAPGATKPGGDFALEEFLREHADLRLTGFQPSNSASAPHVFLVDQKRLRPLRILLDPYTLKELGRFDGSGTGPVGWYQQNFGILHTMAPFGLTLRLVWGLCSLGGAILVGSGIWVSIKRWRRARAVS